MGGLIILFDSPVLVKSQAGTPHPVRPAAPETDAAPGIRRVPHLRLELQLRGAGGPQAGNRFAPGARYEYEPKLDTSVEPAGTSSPCTADGAQLGMKTDFGWGKVTEGAPA